MPFIHGTTVAATGCSWQASSRGRVRQEVDILHKNKLHWADLLLSAAEKIKAHYLGQQLSRAVRCLLQMLDASVSRAVLGARGWTRSPALGAALPSASAHSWISVLQGKDKRFARKKRENASLIDYFAKVVENCSCPLRIYSGRRGMERFSEAVR